MVVKAYILRHYKGITAACVYIGGLLASGCTPNSPMIQMIAAILLFAAASVTATYASVKKSKEAPMPEYTVDIHYKGKQTYIVKAENEREAATQAEEHYKKETKHLQLVCYEPPKAAIRSKKSFDSQKEKTH